MLQKARPRRRRIVAHPAATRTANGGARCITSRELLLANEEPVFEAAERRIKPSNSSAEVCWARVCPGPPVRSVTLNDEFSAGDIGIFERYLTIPGICKMMGWRPVPDEATGKPSRSPTMARRALACADVTLQTNAKAVDLTAAGNRRPADFGIPGVQAGKRR